MKPSGASLIISGLLIFGGTRTFSQEPTIQFTRLGRVMIEKRLRLASGDDRARESILESLFQEAGCTGQFLAQDAVKHQRVPNLVCTMPGSTDSLIIVGGHMDHVSIGRGVVDDWSGAALLPSLFQSLRDQPRKHTFLFIGFTDEEGGLVGSRSYVHHLDRVQLKKIRGMVNLECLGLAAAEIWGRHADPALMKMFGAVAHTLHSPYVSNNPPEGADDDADSFRDRKVPTITIHSMTTETWPILHSPRDDFSAINWNDYYNSYELLAAYLAFIDYALPQ
jgi:Iap family predicted aminopeptidase